MPIKAKVETLPDYKQMKKNSDSLTLIQGIKNIVYDIVTQNKYKPQAMHEALRRFYMFKQDSYMSDSDYLKKYKTIVEVCQAVGVTIGSLRSRANDIMAEMGDDPNAAQEEGVNATMTLATQHYQAVAFLLSSDRSRYDKMI